jgi:peptidyl-tRNA hydrolase, PTH1 family
MSGLYIIAGLGNPGLKYSETRHNAGFWFLDELAQRNAVTFREQTRFKSDVARIELYGQDCLLLKPGTFMNHSGQAIRAAMDYFEIQSSQLLVAYDELDLPVGMARLKSGGGHGGHNGLRDIFQHWPDREFLRVRIGIGHPGVKAEVTDYVLGRPTPAEEKQIRASISEVISVLPDILACQLPRAMKALHTRALEN